MVNGQHRKPPRWRRKILGLPVFGWLIGLTGTALAAVIGYLVLMGVSGTFEPSAEILVYYEVAGPISAEPRVGSPTCTATFVSEDEVQFGATAVMPGDVCRYTVTFDTDLAVPSTYAVARLNGFNLDSPDFAGGGITARLDNSSFGGLNSCGKSMLPGEAQVFRRATVNVDILFNTVSSSDTFTLNPALDGFDWRAESLYVPSECT